MVLYPLPVNTLELEVSVISLIHVVPLLYHLQRYDDV
jgi:hypothetical protein